jgi:crotonobetainyl-CoA:carnitine CoA-transferase CaiB-like acyl-CoA transferase
MAAPLRGMRVLELAQIMAGPTCGMMLADLGANVVKIEKIPGGDDSRSYSEPRLSKGEHSVSAPYLILNRNKRGLALNLKDARGADVLRRMVKQADVLTENYRAGTMEKLGLGEAALRALNPGLIYCAISGFGRSGPMAEHGGFDLIAQGFSGLMSVTGEPNGPPVKTGNSVADINAGILAGFGIVAAYVEKLKTGRGQVVETSLMEAGLQQLYWQAAIFFATGQSAKPTGSAHLLTAPYQAFRCADGYLNIGGANQSNWERIAVVLGSPEWKTDPRFATNKARMTNTTALVELMHQALGQQTVAHWMQLLEAAGVPCGPVHSVEQALTHPQTLARDMVVEVDHPSLGTIRAMGTPIKLSDNDKPSRRAAPGLGEHSQEILQEFGFSQPEISDLVAAGVVASPAY